MAPGIGIGIGIGLTPTKGGGGASDAILAYFGDGTDGFLFDFSKTDQLFQDAIGTIPSDDTGENIGLALEGHSWAGRSLAQQLLATSDTKGASSDSSTGTGTSSDNSGVITWTGVDSSNRGGRKWDISSVPVGGWICFEFTVLSGSPIWNTGVGNVSTSGLNGSTLGFNRFYVQRTSASRIALGFITASGGGTHSVSGVSMKVISGSHGLQAATAPRPKYQTGGWARFDGFDDNELTTKNVSTTGFIMGRCLLTGGSTIQLLVGAVSSLGTDRVHLGVDASNQPYCRIGNGAGLSGVASIAGVDCTIGVRWNGTTVDLLLNGAVVATQAQTGAPTTIVPLCIGANNNNGTAANFFNGDAKRIIHGDKALTNAAALAFHTQLMAA